MNEIHIESVFNKLILLWNCQQRFKSDSEEWRDGRLDFTAKIWDALTGDENRPDATPREVDYSLGSIACVSLLEGNLMLQDQKMVPLEYGRQKIEGFQVAKDKKAEEKEESSDV
ncbi:hypothetical protein IFM89_013332 [Coptis chinensis]|uniref:Uncharacterized protein n=1 Tax=Coptis chinensis TaxID=261450 RepID=A0A835LJ60_9MAGN|nr:hypothetical protein IFM89_013332 [Coptis chinensis]